MSEGAEDGESVERGRILIVRHAQSTANAGEITMEHGSVPITETGIRQAQCVADFIAEKPSLIVVSPFLRTLQTAEPLLRRYPDVPMEEWPIEEFTHLDLAVCAGTTYADRKCYRDTYWGRSDPMWVDGPGCESFAGFLQRVRCLEGRLNARGSDDLVVVFTHGFVMRVLRWLQQHPADPVTSEDMADFFRWQTGVSMPNCGVIRAEPMRDGRLRCEDVSVAHLPLDLQTG